MRISDWSSDVCSSDLTRRDRAMHRPVEQPRRYGSDAIPWHWQRSLLCRPHGPQGHRSEEHTSELQSLLSISYAVFCLNKKKHTPTHAKANYHLLTITSINTLVPTIHTMYNITRSYM